MEKKKISELVEEARKIQGVIGSRMTGAGFGGCTVSIVNEQNIEEFYSEVYKEYYKKTGLKPEFYAPDIEDGTKQLFNCCIVKEKI